MDKIKRAADFISAARFIRHTIFYFSSLILQFFFTATFFASLAGFATFPSYLPSQSSPSESRL